MINVAIIDSWINNVITKGVTIIGDTRNQYEHGNIVYNIIKKECEDIDVDVYPIFEGQEVEENLLIDTLEFIAENKKYDVINLSLAVVAPNRVDSLREACNKIAQKGTIIVSAFDNWGSMSYPACFDSVIGVDIDEVVESREKYFYVEGGCIDLICSSKPILIDNIEGKKALFYGTSFYAAYFSGYICKLICQGDAKDNITIRKILRQRAERIIAGRELKLNKPEMSKVILFPYGKETLSAYRLKKYSSVDIKGIYDIRLSKHIGEEIIDINGKSLGIVQSSDRIQWSDDWDTLVVGHLRQYKNIPLDYYENIINQCRKYKKRIYAFDSFLDKLCKEKDNFFSPKYDNDIVPIQRNGKMWHIDSPVLAIVGTKSKQGKFSTEVRLVDEMRRRGYDVGFISTEPSGYLFGANVVFPYGFNSEIKYSEEEMAIVFNEIGHVVESGATDIVVYALQSGMIPSNEGNVRRMCSKQQSLLFGLPPDAYILCVSADDDVEYIRRNILYLENMSDAPVVGIFVSPIVTVPDKNGELKNRRINDNILSNHIKTLKNDVYKECFRMDKRGISGLTDCLENFFSE